MMANDDEASFAPKRYGYGAGLPIRWQGWAVLALYLLVLGAAGFLVRHNIFAYGASVIIATVALLVVCAAHTRGGWRWRWGED